MLWVIEFTYFPGVLIIIPCRHSQKCRLLGNCSWNEIILCSFHILHSIFSGGSQTSYATNHLEASMKHVSLGLAYRVFVSLALTCFQAKLLLLVRWAKQRLVGKHFLYLPPGIGKHSVTAVSAAWLLPPVSSGICHSICGMRFKAILSFPV